MADQSKKTGAIGWIDLTVPDAMKVRDFYAAVVGWESSGIDMGDYEDFCVAPPGSDQPVAGICHARKMNADQPAQWMIYINVDDLDASVAACNQCGGAVIVGPRNAGGMGRYAVIRDPAGAVCALFEPAK